jgi:uncharacterized surface protein with fasciclin (FAS1) repeats
VKCTPLARGVLVSTLSGLVLAVSACGSDGPSGSSASSSTTSSATSPAESSPTASADAPFGAGCAALPADGPGSAAGMAAAPVGTAAAANPLLSSLVQAVTAANLVEPLNTAPDITVLAPANPAFDALPADQRQALLADSAQLTAVLLHHVIQGRLSPAQLPGTHTTLNNDSVTIGGSGEAFTVAGEGTVVGTPASVTCGDVQTANATVYVIDQVLKPAQ